LSGIAHNHGMRRADDTLSQILSCSRRLMNTLTVGKHRAVARGEGLAAAGYGSRAFLRGNPRQQLGRQQVVCDHGASARVRRTLRLVQDIAALLRFKFLQLSCSKDRTCDVVFTARWASNAHVVNCGRDLLCVSAADGAVHILAPLVAIDEARPRRSPTTARGLLPHAIRHCTTLTVWPPYVSSPPIGESHPPANFGPAGALPKRPIRFTHPPSCLFSDRPNAAVHTPGR
jgi:hypothetical protein